MKQSLRHIAWLVLAALGLVSCTHTENYVPPTQRTPSYLAVETYSGRILFSGNPNELRPIGMLANIATALVIIDWMDKKNISMNQMLTVPATACQWQKTNLLNLAPGDRISIRDALHSAIMWDDSACAATLAHACGSTINPSAPEEAFVTQMNQMGRAIGMRITRFKGSSGAVVTQSDTYDMAKLGMYAMLKPIFRSICEKREYVATVNNSRSVTIVNSNSMLSNSSVDGVRAARSSTAGACLMVAAQRAGVKLTDPTTGAEGTYPQRLLIIVLGAHSSQSRYKVASLLLRDCWKAWEDWQQTNDFSDHSKFIILSR